MDAYGRLHPAGAPVISHHLPLKGRGKIIYVTVAGAASRPGKRKHPEGYPGQEASKSAGSRRFSPEEKMSARKRTTNEWPVYARSVAVVGAGVAVAAVIQVVLVYGEFHARFLIIPALVAIVVGLLVGRLAVLRERLRKKSREFRAIVDLASEFSYLRSVDGRYEYVSPYCEKLTGYTQEEFYREDNLMDRLIHPEDRPRWDSHLRNIHAQGASESFDIRLVAKGGQVVWITHICSAIEDNAGRPIGVRATNLDITQRKLDQQRIERLARFDPLTELPNRRVLENDIKKRVTEGQKFALLFLDLTRFKNVNDSLGHSFGDRLLQKIAQRLRTACREDCLLCRFGGDEFVIVLPKRRGRNATEFAMMLLDEVERPLKIGSSELHIGGTIGIAFCPQDGQDTETLVRNADAAMYRAKRTPHERILTYHTDYSREAARFISTESEIHNALKEGQFIACYQPKVDLNTGRIVSLECLARWEHPRRGRLPPEDFIPVAEETGQITDLGRQIVAQVIDDMARWRSAGIAVPVAVNISPRQFSEEGFVERLERQFQEGGCDPALIELEITEQVFLGEMETTSARLKGLCRSGFHIGLDDFGTGYSSFNYLRGLPIGTLKLDRAFLSNLIDDPVSQAICRAVISLCRELNMTLVAEGVETEQQRQILLEYGCTIGQGFLFYRPLSRTEVTPLLHDKTAAERR
jgi:diguanylate cyclase (GGDEF)-like protein/PAS domain S-box-containing protein